MKIRTPDHDIDPNESSPFSPQGVFLGPSPVGPLCIWKAGCPNIGDCAKVGYCQRLRPEQPKDPNRAVMVSGGVIDRMKAENLSLAQRLEAAEGRVSWLESAVCLNETEAAKELARAAEKRAEAALSPDAQPLPPQICRHCGHPSAKHTGTSQHCPSICYGVFEPLLPQQ